MTAVGHDFISEDLHPIDIVESLATHRDWDFDRIGEDQIAMAIEGSWTTYSISLNWSGYDETLRLICTFDLDAPDARVGALAQAQDMANDLCWTGGFVRWPAQKLMVYRYALTLAGGAVATAGQISAMLTAAVEACERFHPAFQLVAFGETPPKEAIDVAIAEAYGRA
jgi:hypothetical protein